MRRTALILGGVIATALAVSIVGPFTFYADVTPLLSPVLSRPPGVPQVAVASYDWKASGLSWNWSRTSAHGCASWTATDRWVDVHLLVGSECAQQGHRGGQGLSYFSAQDYLTFQDFWPWSADDHFKQIVFDAQGMISSVRPCPYTLSTDQIDAMRVVAREALTEARTDGERRVLNRIRQRLDAVGRAPLASGQDGCTDSMIEHGAQVRPNDVWTRR